MNIVVGSQNPVKIAAVRAACELMHDAPTITSIDAESGISNMPTSEKEALKGAKNRAKNCLAKGADMGVGLEGYVEDKEDRMFLLGLVVAMTPTRIGIGMCGGHLLPENIAKEIRKGRELGPVMDEYLNDHNTKQKQGAVGYFTKGLVTRKEGFKRGVIFAMAVLQDT